MGCWVLCWASGLALISCFGDALSLPPSGSSVPKRSGKPIANRSSADGGGSTSCSIVGSFGGTGAFLGDRNVGVVGESAATLDTAALVGFLRRLPDDEPELELVVAEFERNSVKVFFRGDGDGASMG